MEGYICLAGEGVRWRISSFLMNEDNYIVRYKDTIIFHGIVLPDEENK
jgi:hypothetical protein